MNPLPLKPPSGYATAFHSNYDPIFYRFQDIKRRIMACLEDFKSKLGVTHLTNLGCTRSLKSTDPVFHFSADSMGQSSFTFTHLAPEKKLYRLFEVSQGHRNWYQSKADMRLPQCVFHELR